MPYSATSGPPGPAQQLTETLLCEVDDAEHTLPTLLSAGPGDELGRGLRVVGRLAREWGTSRTGTGKTVWFEMTLPGRRRRR